ncbi:GroES-like protein [Athelia psychrophila]|uniref:GroES-like protein n=1 Tax=Athelia psychrophila TaxID=1759441 RepID=A0A166AX66_9AGAM|nr:GroES-like protein [Fibularhizoctonia sp. CBS 109695]
MSSANQKALFLPSKHADFAVGPTGIPTPGGGELLAKSQAIGLNPIEWKIQKYGVIVETSPAIIGTEFPGIVEAVGEGVTSFQTGDKLPPSISFEQATSIPTGVSTAAIGLYQNTEFGAGLTAPWEQCGKGKYKGKPLLVLGGGGSLCPAGHLTVSQVIQFARLSRFSPIIATASLHNSAHLQSLGATHVVDRSLDASLLREEIAKITSAPIEVVLDTVGSPQTQQSAVELLAHAPSNLGDAVSGGKRVRTSFASPFHPFNRSVGAGYFSNLTAYIESGDIQVLLPSGLNGILGGLARLEEGKITGVKLIVRPQETI